MAEIDVIVPNYNVERFLDHCVDSILGQSFTNFELILIDDGAPDHCGKICDEYAMNDSRVVVIHGKNRGVSGARNLGLDLCNSEFITFCDSDDYYDRGNLENLYAETLKDEVDLVSGNYYNVTTSGEVIGSSKKEAAHYTLNSEQEVFRNIVAILSGRMGWSVWTKLFRNCLVQKNKIRFCTTCDNLTEDLGFVLEYLLYCRNIVVTDYCGYRYVQHEHSMMHRTAGVAKFNSSNEVAKQFGERFYEVIQDKKIRKYYPMLYYRIWQIELSKMQGNYDYLERENRRIHDQKWFKENMHKVLFMYKPIERYFGTSFAKEAVLFASFAIYGWRNHFKNLQKMKRKINRFVRLRE